MKGIQKRLGSLLMAAVMLLSLAVTPAMAAGEKEPPTKVKICEVTGFMPETLNLDLNDETWLNAIKNDTEPLVKPEQAFVVTQILEGIYKAAETGKEVFF